MKNYEVTIYFSETYTVEAHDEAEAQRKAYNLYKNLLTALVPDEYETRSLDEEEE